MGEPVGTKAAGKASRGHARPGDAADQKVRLRGGNAEFGADQRHDQNGKKAAGNQAKEQIGIMGEGRDVDQFGDGAGDRGVMEDPDENKAEHQDAEEIEDGAHDDGRPSGHGPGRDASRDGIGPIGPTVDENDAEIQKQSGPYPRVCDGGGEEFGDAHNYSLALLMASV